MRQSFLPLVSITVFLSTGMYGQTAASAKKSTSDTASKQLTFYIEPTSVDFKLILPLPPTRGSSTVAEELTELHRIESIRTPSEVAQAQKDDAKEDIFLFSSVMGKDFRAELLPSVALLSTHIRKDESTISGPLKKNFHRARPYQLDSTLHAVCPVTAEPNSYPSGHSLSGYLLALTLVQLVPEMREQILKRADDYAHNRLICGVHYPSDLEASRKLAYAMFGALASSPNFQKDLSAAREEIRSKLNLSSDTNQQ